MDHPTITLSVTQGEVLLDSLVKSGIELEHECGGTLACATCRVIVRDGLERLEARGEDELDMLDRVGATTPGARLACQAVGTGGDVVIDLPRREAAPAPLSGNPLAVSLSEAAVRHFTSQLARHPGAVAVRLSVAAAGCSGFGYRVDPVDHLRPDDTVFESYGIRIAVDPASLPRVRGTALDVVQEGLARRLRFDNPNASQSCGCGKSFGT